MTQKVLYPQLYEMYIIREMPMRKIAKELNVASGTVFNYLKKYGIKTRSQTETFTMKGRKLTPEHIESIRHRMTALSLTAKLFPPPLAKHHQMPHAYACPIGIALAWDLV